MIGSLNEINATPNNGSRDDNFSGMDGRRIARPHHAMMMIRSKIRCKPATATTAAAADAADGSQQRTRCKYTRNNTTRGIRHMKP